VGVGPHDILIMEAVVSDIIRSRMREPGGLRQTAALSLAVHAAALALIATMPGNPATRNTTPPVVMTISLGGTPGPKTGGLTTIGGRTIQPALPSVAPKITRNILPTPKAEPAMVLPVPDPKIKPKTAPKPTATSKDPTGGAAGRGAEAQKGSTSVETSARGMGFGLSSGGGAGSGSSLDVQNFCCPEYLGDMVTRIRTNWVQQQDATGAVLMKFTIVRGGQITDIQIERSSSFAALDLASQRALYLTTRLQPLPSAFPDDHLTVHLAFEYQRK
jgi:TonB family protein